MNVLKRLTVLNVLQVVSNRWNIRTSTERGLRTSRTPGATQSTPTYHGTCPQCEAKRVSTSIQEEVYIYGTGESEIKLHVEIPVHECKQCEFQFTDWVAAEIKHTALCQHFGVLNPTEIKQLRKKHHTSRKTLAELTGLDEAYLKKLENGINIQNTAHDRLLRLLDSPVNLNKLQRIVKDIQVPDRSNPFQNLKNRTKLEKEQHSFKLQ